MKKLIVIMIALAIVLPVTAAVTKATLINSNGDKVVITAGSSEAQNYFGNGYVLMGTPYNAGVEKVCDCSMLGAKTADSWTAADLTSTDDLTVADDATVGGDLSLTGTATIGGKVVTNRSILATSSATASTLTAAQLIAYEQIDFTYTGMTTHTMTLPGTSTLTAFLPNAGDCTDFMVRNLTTVAASTTTITAGTGITIYEHVNGDEVLGGTQTATIEFCRQNDTNYISAFLQEWVASD